MTTYKLKYPDSLPKRDNNGFLSDEEMEARYNWMYRFVIMNEGLRPSYRDIAEGWGGISVTATKSSIDRMIEMGWLSDIATNKHGLIFNKPQLVDLPDLELPKVSVIITTYERPHSLQRLIDLLAQQKHTDKNDFEIIVMNDGSDKDYDGLNYDDLNVNYQYHPRREDGLPNVYGLKNKAAMLAENELLWLLDDDLVIDDHTMFIMRSYHALLKGVRPVLCPHTANPQEPYHFQAPFSIITQPADWDKVRVWTSFAGISMAKVDWLAVDGIDEIYCNAMGFADLDLGVKLWKSGCQVMLVDGITVFVDDRETGSHRDRFIHTVREHHNGNLFMEKWGFEEAAKYGITP